MSFSGTKHIDPNKYSVDFSHIMSFRVPYICKYDSADQFPNPFTVYITICSALNFSSNSASWCTDFFAFFGLPFYSTKCMSVIASFGSSIVSTYVATDSNSDRRAINFVAKLCTYLSTDSTSE